MAAYTIHFPRSRGTLILIQLVCGTLPHAALACPNVLMHNRNTLQESHCECVCITYSMSVL